MSDVVTLLSRVVLAASGLALLGLAYRARAANVPDRPAVGSYAVLLSILGVTGLALAAIGTVKPQYTVVWLLAYLAIPVALAVFSFEYYGLDYLASRPRVAAFLAPAGVAAVGGVAVILGNAPVEGAMGGGRGMLALPPEVVTVAAVLQRLGVIYASGVMLVAIGLVVRTVATSERLTGRLAASLSFIGVWPWVAYLVTPSLATLTSGAVGIATLAGCYVASVAASGLAQYRFRLFDSTPAAGTVGPETVLGAMDEAVLVVGHDRRVVRANEAASEAFAGAGSLVDRPIDDVLGMGVEALRERDSFEASTTGGKRRFEATVSPITEGGHRYGHAVVLRDITERRTREQRLEVLNRVLRHNLRNDVMVIMGQAEVIGDREDVDAEDAADSILRAAGGLVDLGDRAREIEEMMSVSRRPDASADLAGTVTAVVEDVTTRYPDVAVTTDLPADVAVAVDERLLLPVLRNLVENAAEHNDADDPRVEVSATVDRSRSPPVEVRVADNGPGIPEQERAVLSEGDETPLQHGSGLGLWAIHWGVTRMGGDLSFAENDPRGSVVRVGLPAADPDADAGTATGDAAAAATGSD